MLRIIFNDGIMERRPLEVLELPANEKLTSRLWRLTSRIWRLINYEAMWLASVQAETGMVAVYIYRIHDEEDPWYRDDVPTCPYGERICSGLASRLTDQVTMSWCLPGREGSWDYRTVNIKPEEDCYHD